MTPDETVVPTVVPTDDSVIDSTSNVIDDTTRVTNPIFVETGLYPEPTSVEEQADEIQRAINNISFDRNPNANQEERNYSRIREVLEQRGRAPRGTVAGLTYKPIEGISNTLNAAADDFLSSFSNIA